MKRRRTMIWAGIVLAGLACGPRQISKGIISRADEIASIRATAEGDRLLLDGKDHLAMLKFLEASQLNPYDEKIFNKLAVTYSRLKMYTQAKKAVSRSIGLNRQYPYAYNTRGIVELANQNFKGASRSFSRAIALEPEVANFYLNLGYTQIQQGRYQDATRSYRKAYEIEPNVLAGSSHWTETSIESPDADPAKYYEMARVFAELGSLEFCLKYLEQALSAGFSDFSKLLQEDAFQKFSGQERFERFLQMHGIKG